MTSTEPDARYLASQPVGAAASLNLDSFSFNYLNMDDNATLTVSVTLLRHYVTFGDRYTLLQQAFITLPETRNVNLVASIVLYGKKIIKM